MNRIINVITIMVLILEIPVIQYYARRKIRNSLSKYEMFWRKLENDYSDNFYRTEAGSLRRQARRASYSFWGIFYTFPILFKEAEDLYNNKEYYDAYHMYHELIYIVDFQKNLPKHVLMKLKCLLSKSSDKTYLYR